MKEFFSLDIGNSSIKIIQLSFNRSKVKLAALAEFGLPVGFVESDSQSDQKELSSLIKKAVLQCNIKTANVVVSLPSNKMYWEIFDLPYMTSDELEFTMPYEAKFRFQNSDNRIQDWQILNKGMPQDHLEIFLVSVPKHIPDKYTRVIKGAGLNPLMIGIESSALVTAIGSKKNEGDIIILHIGAIYSLILLVSKGRLRLARSLNLGSQLIIANLAKSLDIPKKDAEKLMINFGLTSSKFDGHVYESIKFSLGEIMVGVQGVIDSTSSNKLEQINVEEIILSGGVAMMPRLTDYISQETSKKVSLINPWSQVDCSLMPGDKIVPVSTKFALAVGLSLNHLSL